MDRLIYVAMTGAKHAFEQQAVVAHNLANASTTGFKAELATFRAAPTLGPSGATRAYTLANTLGADFSPGPLMDTGRPLDIALTGPGWIAVQGTDGREAYTRNGDLHIGANGLLQTRSGLNVRGVGNIPIGTPPNTRVSIGADGTVSTIPTDSIPNSVTVVGRVKLVNPPASALERGADGMFRQSSGRPAEADDSVQLTTGALEGSNVNPVLALVQMITETRQFEMQIGLQQSAQENDRAWSNVMSQSG